MDLTFPIIVLAIGSILIIGLLVFHAVYMKRSIRLAKIPDKPRSFGYKTYWYALKTIQTEKVVNALKLQEYRPSNWEYGLKHVFSLGKALVFVAPPVHGWTLVLGGGLPFFTNDELSEGYRLFLHLSELFIEAQFFSSFRSVDYYSWARAVEGHIVRAFSIGQYEEEYWEIGDKSTAEANLDFVLHPIDNYLDGEKRVRWPTERDVLKIAGQWSVNPLDLEGLNVPPSVGVIGEPLERIRNAA